MFMLATCLGYPRIGVGRELKRALESFWTKKSSLDELLRTAANLRLRHWTAMKDAGIDHVPSNDFSLYDHVLDTAVMFGAIPARFRSIRESVRRATSRWHAGSRSRQRVRRRSARDDRSGSTPTITSSSPSSTRWQTSSSTLAAVRRDRRGQRRRGRRAAPRDPGPTELLADSRSSPPGAAAGDTTLASLDTLDSHLRAAVRARRAGGSLDADRRALPGHRSR